MSSSYNHQQLSPENPQENLQTARILDSVTISHLQQQQKHPESSVSPTQSAPVRKRVRTGCLNCRRKHKKCDEVKPICTTCSQKNEICEWPAPKNKPAQKYPEYYSGSLPPSSHLMPHQAVPLSNFPPPTPQQQLDHNTHFKKARIDTEPTFLQLPHHQIHRSSPVLPSQYPAPQPQYKQFNGLGLTDAPSLLPYPWPAIHTSLPNQALHIPQSQADKSSDSPSQGSIPSLSQSQLQARSSSPGCDQSPTSEVPTPLVLSDDELQRSEYLESQFVKFLSGDKSITVENCLLHTVTSTATIAGKELTKFQEITLMKHYLNKLARHLDMFDPDSKLFQLDYPSLIRNSKAAKYSIYSLSLVQLTSSCYAHETFNESPVSLFERAVTAFLEEVRNGSLAPKYQVATVLILQNYSIIINKPELWRRYSEASIKHLLSCGLKPNDGELDSACIFWACVMLDINSTKLLEQKPTIKIELEEVKSCPNLMHRIVGYLNIVFHLLYPDPLPDFESKWEELWISLDSLREELQSQKQNLRMSPLVEAEDQPFPMLLFGNQAAVLFEQVFITIKILLIQDTPRLFKAKYQALQPLSWYVKRTCGITQWNKELINWFNTPLSLCVAAKVLTHQDEHKITLKLLKEVEQKLGIRSRHNTKELVDFWNGQSRIS